MTSDLAQRNFLRTQPNNQTISHISFELCRGFLIVSKQNPNTTVSVNCGSGSEGLQEAQRDDLQTFQATRLTFNAEHKLNWQLSWHNDLKLRLERSWNCWWYRKHQSEGLHLISKLYKDLKRSEFYQERLDERSPCRQRRFQLNKCQHFLSNKLSISFSHVRFVANSMKPWTAPQWFPPKCVISIIYG